MKNSLFKLLNRELKVKLSCFKILPKMELFRNIEDGIGTESLHR